MSEAHKCFIMFVSVVLFLQGFGATPAAQQNAITIQVEQLSHEHSIEGARVFVLDTGGKEIASAVTDNLGIARISLRRNAPAKYVLVEHPAYFISGLRWLTGSEEYYILMAPLTLK